MSKSKPKIITFRIRLICIIFIMFIICTICSPSWAGSDSSSWIKWLLDLLAADAVPERPLLTEEDQAAIDKTRIMLRDYPSDAGKSMILGIFAAADGDANEAELHFTQAAKLDKHGSLLPLTMAAQTHLQENNATQAIKLHEYVLNQIQKRPQTPQVQAVNAHLDLAVAYDKLEDPQKADDQIKMAKQLLLTRPLLAEEKGLAYLQLGIVQKEVLKNEKAAIEAWKVGSLAAAESPRLALELNLKVAENVVNDDPKNAEKYLQQAEQFAQKLPYNSEIAARVKLGEQYTRLATLAIKQNRSDAKQLSASADRLLKPALEISDNVSAQMILYKTAALESARDLADAKGQEAEKKELDKEISTVRTNLSLKIVPTKKLQSLRPIKIIKSDIK